jgi:hypothetical protein
MVEEINCCRVCSEVRKNYLFQRMRGLHFASLVMNLLKRLRAVLLLHQPMHRFHRCGDKAMSVHDGSGSSTTITPPLRERPSVYRKRASAPPCGRAENPNAKTTSRDFELTRDSAILLPVANRSSAGMNIVIFRSGLSIQRFEAKGGNEKLAVSNKQSKGEDSMRTAKRNRRIIEFRLI